MGIACIFRLRYYSYIISLDDTTGHIDGPGGSGPAINYRDQLWHHAAVIYDEVNGHRVWVDGVKGAIGSGVLTRQGGQAAIGRDGDACDGVVPSYRGNLSQYAFYSTALTDAQVQAHYNARTSLTNYESAVSGSSPFFYYKMNDTGRTAVDSSGNARNASIENGVYTGNVGPFGSGSGGALWFDGGACSGVNLDAYQGSLEPTQFTHEFWFSTAPRVVQLSHIILPVAGTIQVQHWKQNTGAADNDGVRVIVCNSSPSLYPIGAANVSKTVPVTDYVGGYPGVTATIGTFPVGTEVVVQLGPGSPYYPDPSTDTTFVSLQPPHPDGAAGVQSFVFDPVALTWTVGFEDAGSPPSPDTISVVSYVAFGGSSGGGWHIRFPAGGTGPVSRLPNRTLPQQ